MADLGGLTLECGNRRTGDDRNIVAVELVLGQQLANLELDQLENLGVVDMSTCS